MNLQTIEHQDTCYESILKFGDAIMDKDYQTALDRYAELGYEVAFLNGKSSVAIEGVLKTMMLIEKDIIEALGEYIKVEKEDPKPGDLRLVHLTNVLVEKTVELLHKHFPIFSRMSDEEILAEFGMKMEESKSKDYN